MELVANILYIYRMSTKKVGLFKPPYLNKYERLRRETWYADSPDHGEEFTAVKNFLNFAPKLIFCTGPKLFDQNM